MYKKRIKEWKIMKNYKREEKDAVSRALQRRTQAGKVSHQVMIRNQPVKFQRILRHLKASAGATTGHGSGASSGSLESGEIEVRTPDAESFVLDESTNRHFQADLRRRLSLSSGPHRPIFTHDDLGIAEILCWESVGYFESALSVHARTLSRPDHIVSDPTIYLFNEAIVAGALAELGRYLDARVILNNSFDKLKIALTRQSPQLLPSLLSIMSVRQGDETLFKVWELYREHAGDLCRVYLGVRHPITVIVRSFRDAGDKKQAFKAVLESLLATTLKIAGVGEAHDLPIYLMQLQADTLARLGQFKEAERILRRALTICTAAHGTDYWMTLDVILDLAWLNAISMRNCRHAEVQFDTVLRGTADEEGEVIERCVRLEALGGLAHVARIDRDLPKAEDLLWQALEVIVKDFGPKHEETIYIADCLEGILREQGKHSEADQLSCLYRLEDEYSL
jgi:tetratricopeptide (TPR) repeat protein